MFKKTITIMSVLVIVFLCSSGVYANTLDAPERYTNQAQYLDNTVNNEITAYITKPYLREYDYDFVVGRTYYGTSNNPYPANPYNWNSSAKMQFYTVDCNITVTGLNTNSDGLVYANTATWSILPDFNFDETPECWYVEVLTDEVELYNIVSGQFRFRPVNQNFAYKGRLALPSDSNWSFTFVIHFLYTYSVGAQNGTTYPQIYGTSMSQLDYVDINSITFSNPTGWTKTNISSSANEIVNWWRIDQWLGIISGKMADEQSAYNNNSTASSDLNTSSSSAETQSNTNHQTELSYYNQTNTALNNSGISNYSFNNEQVSGIGRISSDFNLVYNSLGSWTSVYIFSLTLSLGLMIIRHIRPIQRKREE